MKRYLIGFIGLLYLLGSQISFAQPVNEGLGTSSYIELIHGSANPELIDQSILLLHLSNILTSRAPSNCAPLSSNENEGLSNRAPCGESLIPGVSNALLGRLANEYKQFSEVVDSSPYSELCAPGNRANLISMRPENFSELISNLENNNSRDKSEFFEDRAIDLIGRSAYEELINWATENILPNLTQTKVDTYLLMQETGIRNENYLSGLCLDYEAKN